MIAEWLGKTRTMGRLHGLSQRFLYVDNASGHKMAPKALDALAKPNTRLEFLLKNATDLCQRADSFIIQKMKTVWRRRWGEKNFEMIQKNKLFDQKYGSGKLTNPGKMF